MVSLDFPCAVDRTQKGGDCLATEELTWGVTVVCVGPQEVEPAQSARCSAAQAGQDAACTQEDGDPLGGTALLGGPELPTRLSTGSCFVS